MVLPKELMNRPRRRAAREGTTMSAVAQTVLVQFLGRERSRTDRSRAGDRPFKMRDGSVKGMGLHPDAQHLRWSEILERSDQRPDLGDDAKTSKQRQLQRRSRRSRRGMAE